MIIGVAIKHNNKIYRMPRPYRHVDIICDLRNKLPDKGISIKGGSFQGFYIDDDDLTYLNRQDAMIHAKQCGQCPDRLMDKDTLFSEDLW